jgi:hypothetical protein
MIVNAAIFTCSICGESSVNICAYCTKDACSNHRCERCKRCSDCCECEVPLSAEEPIPVALEAVTEPVLIAEPEPEPELEYVQPDPPPPPPPAPFGSPVFLTAEESSVFVKGSVFTEPLAPQPLQPTHVDKPPAHFDESDDENASEPHDPSEP